MCSWAYDVERAKDRVESTIEFFRIDHPGVEIWELESVLSYLTAISAEIQTKHNEAFAQENSAPAAEDGQDYPLPEMGGAACENCGFAGYGVGEVHWGVVLCENCDDAQMPDGD